MKNITVFFTKILIVTSLIFFFSCKKDDSASPSSSGGTSTTTPMTDICGAGSSSYYWPMKIGNSWTMNYISGGGLSYNIVRDTTFNSKKYFIMDVSGSLFYLRYNSLNDLYLIDIDSLGSGKVFEELFLPYNPTVGQTWTKANGETDKIVSLSSTFTSPLCSYSNVLKMDLDYNSDGTIDDSVYFKKGLGYLGFYDTSDTLYLKSVVLN